MKPSLRIALIAVVFVGLAVLNAATKSYPILTLIYLAAFFSAMKPIVGLRSWWHVAGATATATFVWLYFDSSLLSGQINPLTTYVLLIGVAVVGFVSVLKTASKVRNT